MRQELNREDIERIIESLPSTIPHTPIEARKLAERFSTEVWEDYGNTSSEALINLWTKLFESFNEVWLRNQSREIFDKKNLVVPAPTGSGKTLCMRFYAAALADTQDKGMVIITKLISEAQEAAKQINEWSESEDKVAVAYYSDSILTHNEGALKDYPVLIITHENFIRNHHSSSSNHSKYKQLMQFKDGTRTCVVVDESIELIQHIGISKDLIDNTSKDIQMPYQNKSIKGLEDEYKLMSYLSSNYETLFFSQLPSNTITHIDDAKKILIAKLEQELGVSEKEIVELLKFKKTIKSIRDKNSAIGDIKYLLADGLYLYKSGTKIEYRTSTLEVPSQSMVVLDATANVNKAYSYYKDTEVINLPRFKSYENVTIKTHSTKSGLGQDTLVGEILSEDKTNTQAINIFFMSTENCAVFTFKDLKSDILEVLPDLELDHYGNLTGVNNYKDKEHIIIYGMHYKPLSVYFDEQYQALGLEAFSSINKEKTKEIKYYGIAADIIQMINRGSCRGIIDGNKAPPMTVDLPLPVNEPLRKIILSQITIEMPEVNIIEAKDPLKVKYDDKKTKKAVGKDTLFIDNIDISKDRIKVSNVFITIVATKKDKERIIRDIGNPKYRDSYLYLTLKNMNYSAIKDGHWYLVKS